MGIGSPLIQLHLISLKLHRDINASATAYHSRQLCKPGDCNRYDEVAFPAEKLVRTGGKLSNFLREDKSIPLRRRIIAIAARKFSTLREVGSNCKMIS